MKRALSFLQNLTIYVLIRFLMFGVFGAGVAAMAYGGVLIVLQHHLAKGLLVLAGGLGLLVLEAVVIWFANGKNKKQAGLSMLELLVVSLLPPW